MLSHTSGLPDNREVWKNEEFFLTAKDRGNFEPLKHATELNFEPGQRFEYSNPSYNGLALIIEQVAGQKWQSFIRDNIFKPSGMTESEITDGPHPASGVAHGYVKSNGNDNDSFVESDYGEVPTFAAAGNGGVWCSVLDLARYEAAIQDNKFLSKQMIEESRTVYHPKNWSGPSRPSIGYSWFTGQQGLFGNSKSFDVDFVYHTGSQGGFRAFHITIPEKDILFVGLFNRPPDNFRQLISDAVSILDEHNWLEEE